MKKITFNENYTVSEYGVVLNTRTGNVLKPIKTGNTFFVDIYHPERKSRKISINKLIYSHFVQELDFTIDNYVIVPIDSDHSNHHYTNLKKLSRDAHIKSYTDISGNVGGRFSIFNGIEKQISERISKGESMKDIATEYNVSVSSVYRALQRAKS